MCYDKPESFFATVVVVAGRAKAEPFVVVSTLRSSTSIALRPALML